MTISPPPDPPPPDQPEELSQPESAPLPRWVPVLIGVVLVAMAGLAVYTGMRYHETGTLTNIIKPRRVTSRAPASAPPGEPQPGSSLAFPGDDASNTPTANAPVASRSRAEITGGGAAGVQSTVRMSARRGMLISVVPDDAMVYVNDLLIGAANQFDKPDETYDFPAAGSYTVRITAPGFRDVTYVVTVSEGAKVEVVKISTALVSAPPPAAP